MHVGGVTVLAPGLGTGLKRGKFYLRYFTVLIFLKEREIQAGGGVCHRNRGAKGQGKRAREGPALEAPGGGHFLIWRILG